MQSLFGGSTINVPMTFPDEFKDHQEYREYLSWRVQIQMLSSLSTETGIQPQTIKTLIASIIERSKLFPASIPFPKDIRITNPERTVSLFCDPQELFAKLQKKLGAALDQDKIETTGNFADELERLLIPK